MRTLFGTLGCLVFAIVLAAPPGGGPSSAAQSASSPGVTATTIRLGIPYVDLSALQSLGIKLTQGSFPDAYNAVIADLNAHGGINGRKVAPYLVAVNPNGTAPAATACTQLTEDDKIFAAIAPLSPDCYLQQHHTPTINSQFQGALPVGAAPNFSLSPPPAAYDPLQLSVFAKHGVFKNKKIGLYAAQTTDEPEVKVVQQVLKKLHVNVAATGINTAPPSDQTAVNQNFTAIAQRFQNAGVNEVVGVGGGSVGWPQGLLNNQISYNPPSIATNDASLTGFAGSTPSAAPFLKKVLTSTPTLDNARLWADPGIQRCVAVVKKAYPSDTITPYSATSNSSDHSYVAPMQACVNVALFAAIAKAAGKNLTVASLTRAGESLKNFTIPGSGGPVSFAPGRPYALGPVYIGHYDAATHTVVFSPKSATS